MSGVAVILECKIEMPEMGSHIETEVTEEIEKELRVMSQRLSNQAVRIIKKRMRLKIYNQGA